MALPKKLEKGYLNLAMDIGYTKLRWQLQKEEEEGKKVAETENDKNREEENEIMEARTRQVFDCENRVYDERKQRVTDLKECTRIFLPKPLEVNQEAQIEMRREVHLRTSEEYREKECDEKGRQRRNLTLSEQRGLRKLEKRKNEGEIVVIMTDKSSKMCIMKRDDYEQLGEDHVGKDRVVDREEILEREKVLNQHSLSWCKMWRTGKDHGHEDRIRQSKITNSENRAELYLSYKDHKKVPGKTRPIATGCTSNTLALSNSVSSLVESLANSEERKYEVISSEDLLYEVTEHDDKVRKMRIENKKKILKKLKCRREKNEMMIRNMVNEVVEEMMKYEGKLPGLSDPEEGEQPGWSNFLSQHDDPPERLGGRMTMELRANHENLRVSSAHHNAGRLPDHLVLEAGPLEDKGSVPGALVPRESHGGLLEEGQSKAGHTILKEPTERDEEEEWDKKEKIEKDLDEEILRETEKLTESEYRIRLEEDCQSCGGAVEELEMVLLGLDVTALFPSMTAARTGRIVRRRMMKTKIKVDGFD